MKRLLISCHLLGQMLVVTADSAPRIQFTTPEIHKGSPVTDLRMLNSYGDAPSNVQGFFREARALLGNNNQAGFAGNATIALTAKQHGFTHLGGPLLGRVSDRGVAIWLRTIEPATVTVLASSLNNEQVFAEARSSLESQLTAVVELSSLEPATRYTYKVLINGKPVSLDDEASFTTTPAKDARVRIAFGADFHKTGLHNPRLLEQVHARGSLAMLLIGDLAVDDRRNHFGLIRSDYLLRDLSSAWKRFAARVPVYATWDDHDFFGNDCSGIPTGCTIVEHKQLVQCWRENWNNPEYGAGQEGIYFRTRIGPTDVIMLDTRSCRTSDSFLGERQLRWFKEQLLDCKGPFLIISSGTMWSDYISGGKDSWGVFAPTEREQIFSFIEGNKIPRVLLISGDRHGSRGFKIPRPSRHSYYEFEVGSLGGIIGPPPFAPTKAGRDQQLFGRDGIAFGEFEFDTTSETPSVIFRLISEAGQILETVKLDTL